MPLLVDQLFQYYIETSRLVGIIAQESRKPPRGRIPDIAEMDEEKSEFEPSNENKSSKKASHITLAVDSGAPGETEEWPEPKGRANLRRSPAASSRGFIQPLILRSERRTAEGRQENTDSGFGKKSRTNSSGASERKRQSVEQTIPTSNVQQHKKSSSNLLHNVLMRRNAANNRTRKSKNISERILEDIGRRTASDRHTPVIGKTPGSVGKSLRFIRMRSRTPGEMKIKTLREDLAAGRTDPQPRHLFKKKGLQFDLVRRRPSNVADLAHDHLFIQEVNEKLLSQPHTGDRNARKSNSDASSLSKTKSNLHSTGGKPSKHTFSRFFILNPLRLAKEKPRMTDHLAARRRFSNPLNLLSMGTRELDIKKYLAIQN